MLRRIIPQSMSPGEGRGQGPFDPAVGPAQNDTSEQPSSANHAEHAPARYFAHNRAQFSRRVGISIRSFTRAEAAGVIPAPDLMVGRSPRWSEQTIRAFLASRPRLPGRGGRS